MNAPLRVHVGDTLDARARAGLAARLGSRVKIGPFDDDTQVLISGLPSAAQLAAPTLRALLIPYAGLLPPTRDRLLTARPELPVFNLHHNASAVAELALTLALALLRRLVPLDSALRRGDWRPRFAAPCSSMLCERSALILGCGHVGRRLAQMLSALGVSARATRRRQELPKVVDGVELFPATMLDELLPSTDLLFVCAPLTQLTEGLLDARRLGLLRAESLLVNVSRAEIVDEDALYDALAGGHLGGAGLDVWYDFPRQPEARANTWPARRPFWQLDSVVLSPHRAGLVRSSTAGRELELCTALERLACGETPVGSVDVEAGY